MKRYVIILIIASYSHIAADIIYVPQDSPTIQEAIDYASAGDTIIVSAGIYIEWLVVNKSLRIQGSSEDSTIVKHSLYSEISNASDVTIENLYFKIAGPIAPWVAFQVNNSSEITFNNTDFYGGWGASGMPEGTPGGDGVKVNYSNHITFINSTFIGGKGGDGWDSAGMGHDGGDGGNGLTIKSSRDVFIDSSLVILGKGGRGGYGSQGSGSPGDDGYSIYLIDSSEAAVFNSIFIGDYFCDNTSSLVLFNVVGVNNEDENEYVSFALHQNYPNPFNPATKIKYSIPSVTLRQAQSDVFVTLKVYDVLGNDITTLVNEEKPAGGYELEFDGSGLTSGIYFYRLQAGTFVETKKMVLLK